MKHDKKRLCTSALYQTYRSQKLLRTWEQSCNTSANSEGQGTPLQSANSKPDTCDRRRMTYDIKLLWHLHEAYMRLTWYFIQPELQLLELAQWISKLQVSLLILAEDQEMQVQLFTSQLCNGHVVRQFHATEEQSNPPSQIQRQQTQLLAGKKQMSKYKKSGNRLSERPPLILYT